MREKEYGKTNIKYYKIQYSKRSKKEPRPWTTGPGKYAPLTNKVKASILKYSFPKNPKLKYFYYSYPAPNKYNTHQNSEKMEKK